MKKIILASLFSITFGHFATMAQYSSLKHNLPYIMSLEFEYASPTQGISMSVIPGFSIKEINNIWLSVGPHFGIESGFLDDNVKERVSQSVLQDGMRGDVIDSYSFSDYQSGFQYGGKAFLNFLIVTDYDIDYSKGHKNADDWFVISIGARYTFHPETVVEYMVSNHDNAYRYVDWVPVKKLDAYAAFAPEFSINYGMYGLLYAYQKQSNGLPLHTFGIRINV